MGKKQQGYRNNHYTFFALCKHHQINPEEWLQDVLNRIAFTKPSQLPQLLPPFWKPKV